MDYDINHSPTSDLLYEFSKSKQDAGVLFFTVKKSIIKFPESLELQDLPAETQKHNESCSAFYYQRNTNVLAIISVYQEPEL